MKKLIVILACVGLLAFAGAGSATIINFDDIDTSGSYVPMTPAYEGFDWTWYGGGAGGWYVIEDAKASTWGSPDSPSGDNAAFNAYATNDLWIESSSQFNFTSAAFAGQGIGNSPEYIKVSAYFNDTLLGYVEMALSGSDYYTLYGSSAMVGANKLKLTYTPFSATESGYWLMDNFEYEDYVDNGNDIAPIPEPSTLILIGAGLLGLALVRRK